MKPFTRLALLLSLVLGLGGGLAGAARADHELGHDHPFCAQGGGQDGVGSGGEGGTIPEEGAGHFDAGGGGTGTVLIPRHLGERFGEAPPPSGFPDPTAGEQFIEIDADDIGEVGGGGSNGGAFHGGHGGGPGGGQGGSTFFGAGDGGCSPELLSTADRRVPGGPSDRRLPVTGTSAEQFALMGGVFLVLGAAFVFAPQIVAGVNRFLAALFRRTPKQQPVAPPAQHPATPTVHVFESHEPAAPVPAPPTESEVWGQAASEFPNHEKSDTIARLREQISTSWNKPDGH